MLSDPSWVKEDEGSIRDVYKMILNVGKTWGVFHKDPKLNLSLSWT